MLAVGLTKVVNQSKSDNQRFDRIFIQNAANFFIYLTTTHVNCLLAMRHTEALSFHSLFRV